MLPTCKWKVVGSSPARVEKKFQTITTPSSYSLILDVARVEYKVDRMALGDNNTNSA